MKTLYFFTGTILIFSLTILPYVMDPWKPIVFERHTFGLKEKDSGFIITTEGYPNYTFYDYNKDSVPDKQIVQALTLGNVPFTAEIIMNRADTVTFKKVLEATVLN